MNSLGAWPLRFLCSKHRRRRLGFLHRNQIPLPDVGWAYVAHYIGIRVLRNQTALTLRKPEDAGAPLYVTSAPVLKGTSTAWDYLQTLKNVFNARARPREILNTIAKPSANAPGTSLSEKDTRLS